MLTISTTLHLLSDKQRNYLADFIRDFPSADTDKDEQVISIPAFEVPADESDTEELTAEQVFSAATSEVSNLVTMPSADTGRIDKNGLPWDERIHTSSRARNADGSWRRKRGVDDATINSVEAELRAVMAIPPAETAPKAAAAEVPAPVPAASVPPQAPVAPTPAVSSPVASAPATYMDLISRASELITAGKLTQAQLDAAVAHVGLPSLSQLGNRQDLVPRVLELVNAAATLGANA